MERTKELIKEEFESSTTKTEQYKKFHRTFKREFKQMMKEKSKRIEISKPNHFDISGFFELKNGQIYYFSISDLRWSKDTFLLRTAKDFKDYTGGINKIYNIDVLFKLNEVI